MTGGCKPEAFVRQRSVPSSPGLFSSQGMKGEASVEGSFVLTTVWLAATNIGTLRGAGWAQPLFRPGRPTNGRGFSQAAFCPACFVDGAD